MLKTLMIIRCRGEGVVQDYQCFQLPLKVFSGDSHITYSSSRVSVLGEILQNLLSAISRIMKSTSQCVTLAAFL